MNGRIVDHLEKILYAKKEGRVSGKLGDALIQRERERGVKHSWQV